MVGNTNHALKLMHVLVWQYQPCLKTDACVGLAIANLGMVVDGNVASLQVNQI